MDFLIPTISKDGEGFIPRPCTYERAIHWLRDTLVQGGAPVKEVQDLTWHSFRLFAPDCAFQAMIPKDQRQYLGNWSSASLPDVYTREKRHVVCSIWNQVLEALPNLKLEATHGRVDLNHPEWNDTCPAPKKPRRSSTPVSGDGVPNLTIIESAAMVPDSDDEDLQVIQAPRGDRVPIDEVKPPLGPLIPGIRRQKISNVHIMHLFSQQGKAIGCGWQGIDKCEPINGEDYRTQPAQYPLCKLCSRMYCLPPAWTSINGEPQADLDSASSSLSSGSLTDEEADTDSDREALRLPEEGDGVP
jgi:hypothetical protein